MRHARGLWVVVAALALACAPGRDTRITLRPPEQVSASTAVGTAPMFAVSPAGEEALAWISAPGGGTDGRLYVSVGGAAPVEVADPLGPIEPHGESPPKLAYSADGSLNALYAVAKVVPSERFPVAALRFTRSTDQGRHWSVPVTVTDDATFGGHNFHALHAAADSSLYAAWLDGREGKSAAYLARSVDGGRTWRTNRRVAAGEACPCCRTAIASAPDGTLWVAWRLVLPGNIRDVVVARSRDYGRTWTEPVRVHADDWRFPGCPHAGPSLQFANGVLHVAWWTGKPGAAGVFYARSTDGGASFAPAAPMGTADFSMPAHAQVALDPARDIVAVAWDDGTAQPSRIMLRVSHDLGRSFGPAVPVSAVGRVAGFPVLALADREITVAWSEQSTAAAERDALAMPDMKNPNVRMGLRPVGDASVVLRRGRAGD